MEINNQEQYSRNRFAKALILDLLASSLVHLTYERIKDYLENNNYNLNDLQELLKLEDLSKESYQEEATESDDFFPSICLEPETDSTTDNCDGLPEFHGDVVINLDEFTNVEQREQYLALCNTNNHQARNIFTHYYIIHNSGQKGDIARTVKFIDTLIALISSNNSQINKSRLKLTLIHGINILINILLLPS